MRTLHLLKTPDILLANDNRLFGRYWLIKIPHTRSAWMNSERMDQTTSKPKHRSRRGRRILC
ncbi:hypothetical protein SBA5_490001 [Candidatus Sulfotelmatomonas gaucii]|uniref:Uncharacterized protein n=1 Tax=Candidatus Sulfuritelmatomonas gaucii TaxID=2043161 RepID=A0A2N9LPN7_9BACT|nr:hypothetical protein SBA5_490001 [Candidatus Sulfotelmatomonas gaucii]